MLSVHGVFAYCTASKAPDPVAKESTSTLTKFHLCNLAVCLTVCVPVPIDVPVPHDLSVGVHSMALLYYVFKSLMFVFLSVI